MNKGIVALVSVIIAGSASIAQAGDFYVMGAVGRTSLDVNKGDIDNAVRSAGATALSSSLDKNDTGYKVQLGYQVNPYFAVEGGYVNLGKANYRASFTGGTANAEVKADGWNIAALGIYPFNDQFSIFGKLGVIDAKVTASATATGPAGSATASDSSTKLKPNYGIGAMYNVTKAVAIRAEYERFNKLGNSSTTGEANIDLLSLGVSYKF